MNSLRPVGSRSNHRTADLLLNVRSSLRRCFPSQASMSIVEMGVCGHGKLATELAEAVLGRVGGPLGTGNAEEQEEQTTKAIRIVLNSAPTMRPCLTAESEGLWDHPFA